MLRSQRAEILDSGLVFAFVAFAQKAHVSNRLGLTVETDQRKLAMSFSISTLLTRDLRDVFGENNPPLRRAPIDEILTEDCAFYEPGGRVYRGLEEIDRFAGSLRAMHPDFRYQPIAEPEELGNAGRVRWVGGRPSEPPASPGLISSLAGTAGLPQFISFSTSYPQLDLL